MLCYHRGYFLRLKRWQRSTGKVYLQFLHPGIPNLFQLMLYLLRMKKVCTQIGSGSNSKERMNQVEFLRSECQNINLEKWRARVLQLDCMIISRRKKVTSLTILLELEKYFLLCILLWITTAKKSASKEIEVEVSLHQHDLCCTSVCIKIRFSLDFMLNHNLDYEIKCVCLTWK